MTDHPTHQHLETDATVVELAEMMTAMMDILETDPICGVDFEIRQSCVPHGSTAVRKCEMPDCTGRHAPALLFKRLVVSPQLWPAVTELLCRYSMVMAFANADANDSRILLAKSAGYYQRFAMASEATEQMHSMFSGGPFWEGKVEDMPEGLRRMFNIELEEDDEDE